MHSQRQLQHHTTGLSPEGDEGGVFGAVVPLGLRRRGVGRENVLGVGQELLVRKTVSHKKKKKKERARGVKRSNRGRGERRVRKIRSAGDAGQLGEGGGEGQHRRKKKQRGISSSAQSYVPSA